MDTLNNPMSFTFHLIEGSSPLIIGLHVMEFINNLNLLNEK